MNPHRQIIVGLSENGIRQLSWREYGYKLRNNYPHLVSQAANKRIRRLRGHPLISLFSLGGAENVAKYEIERTCKEEDSQSSV